MRTGRDPSEVPEPTKLELACGFFMLFVLLGCLGYGIACTPYKGPSYIDECYEIAIAHPERPELSRALESVLENDYVSLKEVWHLMLVFDEFEDELATGENDKRLEKLRQIHTKEINYDLVSLQKR
ncbi:MAG: hypothetical protein ACW987_18610 [Candidatus Thorarchaeota archaeon]|jgi:hypothetical protein